MFEVEVSEAVATVVGLGGTLVDVFSVAGRKPGPNFTLGAREERRVVDESLERSQLVFH